MKQVFVVLTGLILMLSLYSCQNGGSSTNPALANIATDFDGLVVSGNIQNGADLSIFFDQILLNNSMNIKGKSTIDAKGNFAIQVDKPEVGVYRLRIGAKRVMIALSGTEKNITFNGDLTTLPTQYEINGAPEQPVFQQLQGLIANRLNPTIAKTFVDTTSSDVSALFALLQGVPMENDIEAHKAMLAKFKGSYPTSAYTTYYEQAVNQKVKALSAMKVKVGEEAMDIKLPSPSGKEYALSDLKGQVVLVDFWASWCRPCRITNPNLVKLYDKYKSQGFTVYSVSLDNPGQKARWEKAIDDDKLAWPYHVSDLKGWRCEPAQAYGVRSIPYTLLLDRDGKIAAVNPPKNQLEAVIKANL
ncbi:MAG: TlpA disulfide reductase family protein [Bacteroidota bacterium]